MFNFSGEFWSNLLFKIVAVPFVILLIAVAAHQIISLQRSAAIEQSKSDSQSIGNTLF